MSDHQPVATRRTRRAPRPPRPGARAPAAPRSLVRRHAPGGRDPRARRSAARWTRRASASPGSSPLISGAPRGSPISISATPPRPTKPFRTPSSRSSATSARIARPGRSKSGSRASSSTAASTAGRRAPAATAGSCRPTTPAPATRRGRPFGGAAELDPEARLLARERRARLAAAIDRLDGRQRTVFMLCHYGDCTPREVSAMTGLNESTVRVHLFRAARKLRGAPRRQAVIGRRAPPPRRPAVRVLPRRRGRRAARPAVGRAPGRLRRVRARATPSSSRSWTTCARRPTPKPTRCSRRIAFAQQQDRSCAGSSTLGHPARVISFPGRAVSRRHRRRDAPRRAALARRGGRGRPVRRRRRRRHVLRPGMPRALPAMRVASAPIAAARLAAGARRPSSTTPVRRHRQHRRRRVPVGARVRARAARTRGNCSRSTR